MIPSNFLMIFGTKKSNLKKSLRGGTVIDCFEPILGFLMQFWSEVKLFCNLTSIDAYQRCTLFCNHPTFNKWGPPERHAFKTIMLWQTKGQLISKCIFGIFTFFQKTNENKSTSSKVEFVRLFFGWNVDLKKLFRIYLTFII